MDLEALWDWLCEDWLDNLVRPLLVVAVAAVIGKAWHSARKASQNALERRRDELKNQLEFAESVAGADSKHTGRTDAGFMSLLYLHFIEQANEDQRSGATRSFVAGCAFMLLSKLSQATSSTEEAIYAIISVLAFVAFFRSLRYAKKWGEDYHLYWNRILPVFGSAVAAANKRAKRNSDADNREHAEGDSSP